MALAFASFGRGDTVDYSVRAQSQDTYEIDVTRCGYADFHKELGEPELGFLLVCSADFPFAEGFGPDIKLTRTHRLSIIRVMCGRRPRCKRNLTCGKRSGASSCGRPVDAAHMPLAPNVIRRIGSRSTWRA